MSFLPLSRTIPHPVLSSAADVQSSSSVDPTPPALSPSAQLDSHLASAIAEISSSQTKVVPMSVTGAAPVTLSIKQMIEQSRQNVKAAHEKLTANAAKVAQAAVALSSLGDDLGKEGDDLLAMVGQYKNDLGTGS